MNAPPDLEALLQRQKEAFRQRGFANLRQRRAQLEKLGSVIEASTDALLQALQADLGKCEIEAYSSEIGFVLRDLRHAVKHLGKWMAGSRSRMPLMLLPGRARVCPEPLGVVLILGPWNYPFQLLFSPLVAALAAGNAVCLKPSEFTPATAKAIRDICQKAFDDDGLVQVVTGNRDMGAELVKLPFDHIFFTGSTETGRKVAAAAAENLVPVTLELGGKSPCIVCEDAPLKLTAKRIIWGKLLNAGQTCIAPDYVWVQQSVEEEFLEALKEASRSFVPQRPPEMTADYGRMISEKHFERMLALLDDTNIYDGGEFDRKTLTIAPAIVRQAGWDHPLMQEEIFGPILPVLPFETLEEVRQKLDRAPKPLAAYIFTRSDETADSLARSIAAGGICINDTISHCVPADLPFGGVGNSGHGRYRGKAGFDTFSNPKAVMKRSLSYDLPFRYPPYKTKLSTLKAAFRWIMK